MVSTKYEMQIKTDGFKWKRFDTKKKLEDLFFFSYYKKAYSEGEIRTDARIVEIQTTKTVLDIPILLGANHELKEWAQTILMACDHDWEDIGSGKKQCTYPECQKIEDVKL